jgi:hypothetical protein
LALAAEAEALAAAAAGAGEITGGTESLIGNEWSLAHDSPGAVSHKQNACTTTRPTDGFSGARSRDRLSHEQVLRIECAFPYGVSLRYDGLVTMMVTAEGTNGCKGCN